MKNAWFIKSGLIGLALLASQCVWAERIKDMVSIAG